jgi:large subunit ribosomal protein L4
VSSRLDVRTMDGTVTGTVALDDEVFAVQPNVPLMHQVVTAQLAAARAGTQSTKTRAEVSGGGAKPFKQKGTGRARQGSTRAPHYAGGGVALGPKPRSYRQRTPRKMVQLALRGALSDRASSDRIVVIDKWEFDVPNTKVARATLDTLGTDGRVMVVLARDDEKAYKSLRNLTGIDLVMVGELAAYDVLCSDWLVFSRATLPGVNEWADAIAAPVLVAAKARPAQATTTPEVPPGIADEGTDVDDGTTAAVEGTGAVGGTEAAGGTEAVPDVKDEGIDEANEEEV